MPEMPILSVRIDRETLDRVLAFAKLSVRTRATAVKYLLLLGLGIVEKSPEKSNSLEVESAESLEHSSSLALAASQELAA